MYTHTDAHAQAGSILYMAYSHAVGEHGSQHATAWLAAGMGGISSSALVSCPNHCARAEWGAGAPAEGGTLAQRKGTPKAPRRLCYGTCYGQPTGPEEQGVLTTALPMPFSHGPFSSTCRAAAPLTTFSPDNHLFPMVTSPCGPPLPVVTSPRGHLSPWSLTPCGHQIGRASCRERV